MPPERRRETEAGPPSWPSRPCDLNRHPPLARDLRPGSLPGVVVHAVLLAVPAVGDGRLPEVDLLVVRERLVQVVLRTGSGLDLVHVRARLRVDRRLPEHERLLRLDQSEE